MGGLWGVGVGVGVDNITPRLITGLEATEYLVDILQVKWKRREQLHCAEL